MNEMVGTHPIPLSIKQRSRLFEHLSIHFRFAHSVGEVGRVRMDLYLTGSQLAACLPRGTTDGAFDLPFLSGSR
jgi:hypothetical protein